MKNELTLFNADAEHLEFPNEVTSAFKEKLNLIIQTNRNKLLYDFRNLISNPQIVFLYLNMPDFNGYDYIKRLRNSDHYKNLPISIPLTFNNEQTIVKNREVGASLHDSKSIDSEF